MVITKLGAVDRHTWMQCDLHICLASVNGLSCFLFPVVNVMKDSKFAGQISLVVDVVSGFSGQPFQSQSAQPGTAWVNGEGQFELSSPCPLYLARVLSAVKLGP